MSVRFRPPAPYIICDRSAIMPIFYISAVGSEPRGARGKVSPVYIGGVHEGAGPIVKRGA